MSSLPPLEIVLRALGELDPRGVQPPSTMELELCLGYSREELDEAFRAVYDYPMEDVLDLFAQERLLQCPGELLDDFAGQVTMEHGYTGELYYSYFPYRFGELLLATTPHGLCFSSFTLGNREEARNHLMGSHPLVAHFHEETHPILEQAMRYLAEPTTEPLPPLHLIGTLFQRSVWQTMLLIPRGGCISYQRIGQALGLPQATQAIGTAVGANPLAPFIPCHRVLPKEHTLGFYHWGTGLKAALLAPELL